MAKFPTYEEMGKKVAEKALDEFLYDGKSIREWMQIIASEDAISRQAVLSKIKEVCISEEWEQFRVDNGSNGQRDFLINYIEQLSSVSSSEKPNKCENAISRQAAIDVIFSEPLYKSGMKKRDADEVVPAIYRKIKSLPPVNPKEETVSEFADRCRECGARYGRLLNQKWTPISEGPPKENETVIASTKYGVYPEAKYTKEYGWEWLYEAGTEYWIELEDVEAWMPLPEPYKAEGSEE